MLFEKNNVINVTSLNIRKIIISNGIQTRLYCFPRQTPKKEIFFSFLFLLQTTRNRTNKLKCDHNLIDNSDFIVLFTLL